MSHAIASFGYTQMRHPNEVDAEAFQPKYEKAAVIGLEPSAAFH